LPFRYIELQRWHAARFAAPSAAAPATATDSKSANAKATAAAPATCTGAVDTTVFVVSGESGIALLPPGLTDEMTSDLERGLDLTDEDVANAIANANAVDHSGPDPFDNDTFKLSSFAAEDGDFGLGLSEARPNATATDADGGGAGAIAGGGVLTAVSEPIVTGSVNPAARSVLDMSESEMAELNLKMMSGMSLSQFDAAMNRLGLGDCLPHNASSPAAPPAAGPVAAAGAAAFGAKPGAGAAAAAAKK
jgi:hypothetical protein